MGFAGMYDSGGTIPRGQFGIVGENGPEIVNGPANVTSRRRTAALASVVAGVMGVAAAPAEAAAVPFAGMYDSGGTIPRGQFGIVGENGPEIVNGPANVTSRRRTAALASVVAGVMGVAAAPAEAAAVPFAGMYDNGARSRVVSLASLGRTDQK
ncbi:putative phage tail tape measure protein [Enterobacter cloacae]|uniref:Putative phage tail tape measure protein n=1 Tax=Enterobacter cloacae TaxID=550 RepID=A0A377LTK8_ENTCL|nr:putative phage tail tape measure protein [Enterobacter cloacae]